MRGLLLLNQAGKENIVADIKTFQKEIGYQFQNEHLLVQALTHSSYANEKHMKKLSDNERLEFLGDAVLEIISSDFLYKNYPQKPEGELTKIRAELVCEKSLAEVAARLRLGEVLRLGHGESHGGGSHRPSMLADAVEAVLAASYLDGGMDVPRDIIRRFILEKEPVTSGNRDYKTRFQELVQRSRDQVISYTLTGSSGPDHNKLFTFRVLINGVPNGEGSGRSKKEAEQMAACKALEALKK